MIEVVLVLALLLQSVGQCSMTPKKEERKEGQIIHWQTFIIG